MAATNTRQSPSHEEDAILSVLEWENQGIEVIELKCNILNLESTGPVEQLAQRLYEKYNPKDDDKRSGTRSPVLDDLHVSSSEEDDGELSDGDSPPSRRKQNTTKPTKVTITDSVTTATSESNPAEKDDNDNENDTQG